MDNKKEMKDLNEYKEKLSAVYNLSREMSLSLDLGHISKTVLNTVKRVFNFDICSLLLIDEGKNELYVKEFYGYDEKVKDFRIALDSPAGITAYVARTGESYYCPDAKKDKIYLNCCSKTKSEICVPLKIKDKVIGVLDAESKELNAFSEEDQRLLETLASQAAIAIENARLFRELSSLKEFNETIVSSLNEGIWVEDEKGFCTYANPKMREMLGYESLVGKHWKEIVVPEEISHMGEETRTYGRRSSYESILLTNNGERIPVIVSATPLFEKGKFIGTIGVFVDIREHKKMEESLKKSERLYRSLSEFNKKLLENSPVGIMNINKEMKVEYENPEMRRILEVPFGKELDAMGMDIREIPSIRENGISSIFNKLRKEKEISKEISLMSVSGERIYLSLKGVSLFKGFKFAGAVVIVNDITERKKAEEGLRESEENYRQLVEISPDAIYVHSDRKFVLVNPAMMKILGAANPEELIGRPISDIIHPDYLEIIEERDQKIERKGERVSLLEEKFIRLDGTIINVEAAAAPLIYQGKPAILVVIRDITERKLLEQQREKSRKEAEFYADVLGHDVGNINQIISGHLYLLENAKDEETRKKNVRGIKKSIMKSARLAESMKTLKIIKDTKIEKFDLNKSIERSIKNIKEYSDREIEVNLNIDKKYYVKANDFLDRVFFNIFENAVEYTFHDPVIIYVRTEEKDCFCNVHICDNGTGISKEKRKDILENLETLSKRTGMGFYLTKKILDRFNGKFEIRDVEKGTEIVVSIPVMV